jgi:hypothetical protein
MDEPFDPDKVLITLPLYTVSQRSGGVIWADHADPTDPLLPLFTDQDLAERFIAARGLAAEAVAKPIAAENTAEVLEALSKQGFRRVALDPSGRSGERVRVLPLRAIIAGARRGSG